MNFQLKCGVAVSALCVAAPSFAQDGGATLSKSAQESAPASSASDQDEQTRKIEDVIVTGTLIRGVAPVGTETIRVTPEDIKEAGGVTVQDVLSKVPQLSFFNRQATSGNDLGVGQRVSPQQPSIHGLPTLILLDGRRIASAGTGAGGTATSIDPSIIPTGVLGGIEIVPDGGSATYGSDAVGGVINLTTLRRFDGVKADGTVGFADSFREYRANVTVGRDWHTGSAYLSYSYNQSSALFGAARPFIQQNPSIVTCFPATVTANAGGGGAAVQYSYAGTGADGRPTAYTTGANRCSRYGNESILPAQNMHSVFAGLSQDLNSSIKIDLQAFYSTRSAVTYNAFALVGNATIPTTNPFYLITPAQVGTTRTQRVDFSLAPAVGPNLPTTTKLDNWGVSGELSAKLFGSFQARLLGNYNESYLNSLAYEGPNTTLLTAALARTDATALDPYNAAATPGSTLVAQQIANRPTIARGRNQQTQIRLVTDGSLFRLPGGDVKVAVGGEYLREDFNGFNRITDYLGALTTPDQIFSGSRTVLSAFGEVEIPVISPESNSFIHEFRLSAAGRYDNYSDFGETFNPRFAASLKPVEWLTFRGTFGRSFVAPSLPQLFTPLSIIQSNTAFILPPGATNILVVTGGNPNLQPQRARTWSLGMDVKVPFLPGLRASLTYYNVRFTDKLAVAPFTMVSQFYTPTYANFYVQNPTYQQVLNFVGGPSSFSGLAGFPTLDSLYAAGDHARTANSPNYVVSARSGNVAVENNHGLDFDVNYRQKTSFGSLDFDVAGNYVLGRETAADGILFVNALLTEARFRGSVSVGANIENFRFTTTLFHTSGYGLVANTTTQTYVDQYNTVDSFLSYTFKYHGLLSNTAVSLQVTNLFDVRPSVNLTASTGYAAGNIVGRTFQFGLSRKF